MSRIINEISYFIIIAIHKYAKLIAYIMMTIAALRAMTFIVKIATKMLVKLGASKK